MLAQEEPLLAVTVDPQLIGSTASIFQARILSEIMIMVTIQSL